MSHDCVARINKQLFDKNTQIHTALSFTHPNRELISVATEKLDPMCKTKPTAVFASYCPFCGIKLKA